MEIPDLKKSLLKVLRDTSLHLQLLNNSNSAAAADFVNLSLLRLRPPIYELREDDCCCLCKQPLLAPSSGGEMRIFECGHALHSRCLIERFGQIASTKRGEQGVEDAEEFDESDPFAQPSTLSRRSLSFGMSASGVIRVCPLCYEESVMRGLNGSD